MSNLKLKRARERYRKRLRQGARGFPAATIAFYGPDDKTATKVVLSLTKEEGGEITELERWTSAREDLRYDAGSIDRIVTILDHWKPKSILSVDRIIGCPHEEGIDYPEGDACPECPFWAYVDRWTGEPKH